MLNKYKKFIKEFKLNLKFKIFYFLLFAIMFTSVGYYFGTKSTNINNISTKVIDELVNIKNSKLSIEKTSIKKDAKIKKQHKKTTPIKKISKRKKPKLVLIIDDVYKQSQINAIKKINLKITPSIFPPFKLSMTTNHLADHLKHFMIHLPMQSKSKQFNTQYKTLFINFTTQQIEQRAKELRKLFPKARYINNHTGSVFTKNYNAMYKLYKALHKEGFKFIDSRTTGASKVKLIAKKFGEKYISRDVFIDNIQTIPYIHNQLRKAVKIAKRRGYSIAIGHPHPATLKAISSAKSILKNVDIIYIDELYKKF